MDLLSQVQSLRSNFVRFANSMINAPFIEDDDRAKAVSKVDVILFQIDDVMKSIDTPPKSAPPMNSMLDKFVYNFLIFMVIVVIAFGGATIYKSCFAYYDLQRKDQAIMDLKAEAIKHGYARWAIDEKTGAVTWEWNDGPYYESK